MSDEKIIYMFLDEGGNLVFSDKGTKFFTLTSITKKRPFEIYKKLSDLKYDSIEEGRDIEYFHATEDKQAVRDKVFDVISKNLKDIRIDSLIVEKRKVGPSLREDNRFYPEMLGYLLTYVMNSLDLKNVKEIIVFTDVIPVQKKRNAVEKAIKKTLAYKIPNIRYRLFHHASKSTFYLQIADYCNWAIFRKWEIKDERSYQIIKKTIKSEFDIFLRGTTYYY